MRKKVLKSENKQALEHAIKFMKKHNELFKKLGNEDEKENN